MKLNQSIKTILPLAAFAGLALATSANASLYAYEGFQYSNVGDGLYGEPDGAGTPADVDATGLGDVWDDQLNKAERYRLHPWRLIPTAWKGYRSTTYPKMEWFKWINPVLIFDTATDLP